MPIFTLNFFSIFFWAIVTSLLPITKSRKDLVFLIIIFLQFTLLDWMRDISVGQDTIVYFYGFSELSRMGFKECLASSWEPGYNLWNWVVSHLGGDYHTFLLLTGAFINFSFLRFIRRYSTCVWLSIVIYVAFGFFFGSLHILRQFIALSIILYGYRYLLERRLMAFAIIVLCATSFHQSAIVFIFTYFICHHNIKRRLMIPLFTIMLFLFLFMGNTVMRYLTFSKQYTDAYLSENSSGSGYGMLALLCAIMFGALMIKPRKANNEEKLFYWTFFIALCLQPLATTVSMVSRGIFYWLISVTILLPMILNNIKNKRLKAFSFSITIIGLILFFVYIVNAPEGIEPWATYKWRIFN